VGRQTPDATAGPFAATLAVLCGRRTCLLMESGVQDCPTHRPGRRHSSGQPGRRSCPVVYRRARFGAPSEDPLLRGWQAFGITRPGQWVRAGGELRHTVGGKQRLTEQREIPNGLERGRHLPTLSSRRRSRGARRAVHCGARPGGCLANGERSPTDGRQVSRCAGPVAQWLPGEDTPGSSRLSSLAAPERTEAGGWRPTLL